MTTPNPDAGASDDAGSQSIVVSRVVTGAREVVWRMWTDPKHLAAWWGPRGYTNPECAIDPRPGGRLRILMRSPEGDEYLNVGTVEALQPPERLVFTISLLDDDGSPRLTNHTTVDFEDRGAQTEVTVRVTARLVRPHAQQDTAGMKEGWLESLTRLSRAIEEGSGR